MLRYRLIFEPREPQEGIPGGSSEYSSATAALKDARWLPLAGERMSIQLPDGSEITFDELLYAADLERLSESEPPF